MLLEHTAISMLFPLLIRLIVMKPMNGRTKSFLPAGSDCLLNHLAPTLNIQKTTKYGGNISFESLELVIEDRTRGQFLVIAFKQVQLFFSCSGVSKPSRLMSLDIEKFLLFLYIEDAVVAVVKYVPFSSTYQINELSISQRFLFLFFPFLLCGSFCECGSIASIGCREHAIVIEIRRMIASTSLRCSILCKLSWKSRSRKHIAHPQNKQKDMEYYIPNPPSHLIHS